ncbi:MAG: hypothetical protein LC725_13110, partial [Lentisphaerae bacterium]|nr:hypothetical protein [Lentisphaerota bacterium]
TDRGKTMGDIQQGGTLHVVVDDIPRGCQWRWVIDGREVAREPARQEQGNASQCDMTDARHFVRAELWDPYNRLLLGTNPVWQH